MSRIFSLDSDILKIESDVILFFFFFTFIASLSFSFSFSSFFYLFILTDGQDRLRVYDVEQLIQIKQGNK